MAEEEVLPEQKIPEPASIEKESDKIRRFLSSPDLHTRFHARQLMLKKLPLSYFVENYLYNNEGRPQKLDTFPMLRPVYDQLPQRLLMKCSRKTLKSTILSNIMCSNEICANSYFQIYIANLDKTARNFSKNYFLPRFNSPKIREICPDPMWTTDDVYERVLRLSNTNTQFKYCSEDATRIRSYSSHENLIDECQDINYDELGIIDETLTILETKRQRYAGTPLSKNNTLHRLWMETNQCEWMTKCGCGHWNWLGEGNDPRSMLREEGYSCSKCSRLLDTMKGEWVAFIPSEKKFHGIHLAQPMLPFYNQNPVQWVKIYNKAVNLAEMTLFNEVLGLAYDSASTKPINLEQLKAACILGPMYVENSSELKILRDHRLHYVLHSTGTDWGVNERTSRSVSVQGGLTANGIFEIYWMKNFKNFDYASHIREIAAMTCSVGGISACDGGPDPARGIALAELSGGPSKCQLVRYEHGKVIQRYDWVHGTDWRTGRWVLHRSDVLGWVYRMIKQKKIVFPQWVDVDKMLQDLLNVFLEIREGLIRQEQYYRHAEDEPDDFLHAIAFAAANAFCAAGDSYLTGASSSAIEDSNES